jgi:hypothetical protein
LKKIVNFQRFFQHFGPDTLLVPKVISHDHITAFGT